MASREKPALSYGSASSSASNSTTPTVATGTVVKLIFFTFAMFTLPLIAYFGTVNTLFAGNASWAGALAALTANVVLFGYVIAAVREDQGEAGAALKRGVGKME